jgi:DNA-binding protein HU-beta
MAKKPMSKSQLVEALATGAEVTKVQARKFLDTLAQTAYEEAKRGFALPGLGKLVVVKRKARTGRNPQTGAEIKIPAKTVLKFRIAKACKDSVLTK